MCGPTYNLICAEWLHSPIKNSSSLHTPFVIIFFFRVPFYSNSWFVIGIPPSDYNFLSQREEIKLYLPCTYFLIILLSLILFSLIPHVVIFFVHFINTNKTLSCVCVLNLNIAIYLMQHIYIYTGIP